MGRNRSLALASAIAVMVAAAAPAAAEEAVLRAISAFAEGTRFSRNFERFVEKVNAEGKGIVKIVYLGGPRTMPPFEVGNAVRTGVVDMANVTGAYYTNLMPEADALKLLRKPMAELRRSGGYDLINKLHNDKLNAWFLASTGSNIPFHIYLTKKIDKADLSGLKIRVTPVYKELVEALGGTAVTTAPGEVHTALERGVVDGYGWPLLGIFDLGWHEVTKYRLDPGFYGVEVNVLVNLAKWRSLDDRQRKLLTDAALWLEALDAENLAENAAERERQRKQGIEVIALSDADAKRFLDKADEVGWAAVIKRSPETGAKLRQLVSR